MGPEERVGTDGRKTEKKGWKGNCGWDVIYEKRIQKN